MHGVKKILIPTLLILVTAGAAWGIQLIHFLQPGAYFYMTLPTLFLVDILAATLVIFLGRRIAYSVFFVQLVLGIGLGNYITALGALPSLTTSVQQYSLVSDMGLMAIWDYVNLPLTLLLCVVFFIQCLLVRRLPSAVVRVRPVWAMATAIVLIGLHWVVSLQAPYGDLTIAHEQAEASKGNFKNFIVESVVRRGFCATALAEVVSGRLFEKNIPVERTCSDAATAHLPLLPVTDRIVMVQVESLGGELLDANVDGKAVMPFLAGLRQSAFNIKMDATKKLASANSDYELLNTRIADDKILQYQNVTFFPDSIIQKFSQRGLAPEVWHGVTGNYMELRDAYQRMGFSHLHFKEQLEKYGIKPIDIGFNGVVTDADLFSYIEKRIPDRPFFWFIITMTMHMQDYQPALPQFAHAPLSGFYSECYRTDEALQTFYAALPEGTTFIVYGDHRPYYGNPAPYVPFLVAVKGRKLASPEGSEPIFTRCEVSHYLRSLFSLPPTSLPWDGFTEGQAAKCNP